MNMLKCNKKTNLNEVIEISKAKGKPIACTSEQAMEISKLEKLDILCYHEKEKEIIQSINPNLNASVFDESFEKTPHIRIKVNELLKHLFGENTFEIEIIR